MALVMMAMLCMLKKKLLNNETCPLLSSADIELLLAQFLPCRDINQEEVLRQLEKRHRKRQSSIESAYKNKTLKLR